LYIDLKGIGSGAVRNLRAKTLQQSIVVKGKEGSSNGPSTEFQNKNDYISNSKDKENIPPESLKSANQSTKDDKDWDDLDAEDIGDPLMVPDYAVEIFNYMRDIEVKIY
jgi:hypothetical protein